MAPCDRIEALGERHDRSAFSCGVEALDRCLRTQAGQDMRKRIATCFVAIAEPGGAVAGFYTLSATSIVLNELPAEIAKRLPHYPTMPAALLGRLAVDQRHRGHGLGEQLLFDAFRRTLRSDLAAFAVVVDAKDDAARKFYERYRFLTLGGGERRLFRPMAEIAKVFA